MRKSWSVSGWLLFAVVMPLMAPPQAFAALADDEPSRWAREAAAVTIVRDDWGIAHIHGKTDADAVFGMIYAQCEDDFNRVETNYLNSLGRLAEAEGESRIWQDLRMKLFVDPDDLKSKYAQSPAWLRQLMDAWADGANFYLSTHPAVTPRVIHHFEPWMALSFTEGSIGGDIERVDLQQLEAFYGHAHTAVAQRVSTASPPGSMRAAIKANDREPGGSNGFAVGPARTADHHALLLINPHTSFFFRSELQMVSDQGLNAYGAVTWGQFFVYQGFNDRAGWMHTSSDVDAVDEYLETVSARAGHFSYKYGQEERAVVEKRIKVPYRTASGMAQRTFTVYFTHHGPVTHDENGKWVTIRLMQEPIRALEQSYLRTKARSYAEYAKTMELQANSSNNTVFADADGDIAYWQGNYIPRRDSRFDFTKPVAGDDPATDWKGLLTLAETPQLLNPASGYLFNVNNAPWWGAGESSLRRQDFPVYVSTGGETARGLHAIEVLKDKRDFTLNSLIAAAYDSDLPWFQNALPPLVKAWDRAPEGSPMKAKLREPISVLRSWDRHWSASSVATSVAIFWGQQVRKQLAAAAIPAPLLAQGDLPESVPDDLLLSALASAVEKLSADFGGWQTPWGEINRFQRLTGAIEQPFSDAAPSIAVPFPSSAWGSLASFVAKAYPGTKKWYGTSGNSFVAVVEFGPRISAKAITAGGESGHPDSPHFDEEALRYSQGNLREVYFYPEQLKGHTERQYHPGDVAPDGAGQ
jgi:acyl-homoserine lactone acylase PvdQ